MEYETAVRLIGLDQRSRNTGITAVFGSIPAVSGGVARPGGECQYPPPPPSSGVDGDSGPE
ncbi:hypothetical protein FHX37_0029 [Haloactinospora alba]|uniref:Uncharacterized protein n=1 Tax=Haloactinospora alba TaxID=405555 RepID=A0A543NE94_9ACTN|nr:hypothetical protein FHX37_0029 [Haloactinospora alba]